jgi:hypothetical protein
MTSGSGPSSRIEPARTTSTPCLTHARMMPLFRMRFSTARRIPPAARIVLIARRWFS